MLRLILTTYLAFMTSAGPAVCCGLALSCASARCQGERCAAEKGCCRQTPGGCTKLPRRTTPCQCPNTTGGCCLQAPTIVAKNVNAAAVKERADTEKLNATVKDELAGKGLVFNQPNVAPFRDKLRSAGFYAEWKGKYGDQAWETLEKAVGKLS